MDRKEKIEFLREAVGVVNLPNAHKRELLEFLHEIEQKMYDVTAWEFESKKRTICRYIDDIERDCTECPANEWCELTPREMLVGGKYQRWTVSDVIASVMSFNIPADYK